MCVNRGQAERWDRLPIKLLGPLGKRTMAEVVSVAATRLVWQRREYIWVGYNQGVHSQETGGSGGGCCGGTLYLVRYACHSAFKRSPSNSNGRKTISRALRRERVGPRERPAYHRGVPRVSELCLSTGVAERRRRYSTCCGGWVILKNCTAYVSTSCRLFFFPR